MHCNSITLPLRAKEYISHDPRDAIFGALPYAKNAWPDASLALSEYKAEQLITALEQAIYSAHAHRHTQPSSHVLILPNWQHLPYLARNLHLSYAQKLDSIPYLNPRNTHNNTHSLKLDIYLVANEKALRLINYDYVMRTLHENLSSILGRETHPITINLNLTDPPHLDSKQAYKEEHPSLPITPYTTNPPRIHP